MLRVWRALPLVITFIPLCVIAQPPASQDAAIAGLQRLALQSNWAQLSTTASALGERLARSAHRDAAQYSRIAAYRALAHHHLNQQREALWHWQVAMNLSSDVATTEIAGFPEAASVFAPIGVPSVQIRKDPNIRPARPTRTIRPSLLTVTDTRRRPAAFGVRLIVGRDGVPHSPQVVGEFRDEADRVYSALEAFREWRFAPATEGGAPIEFPMTMSLAVGSGGKPPVQRGRRF